MANLIENFQKLNILNVKVHSKREFFIVIQGGKEEPKLLSKERKKGFLYIGPIRQLFLKESSNHNICQ